MNRRKFMMALKPKAEIRIPYELEEINKFSNLFNSWIEDMQKGISSPAKFRKAYEYFMEITRLTRS